MSMNPNSIPVGADCIARKTGTVVDPGGPNDGKQATIELFRGYFSQGYKSDFVKVETIYFRLRVHGEKAWAFRYSGKRLDVGRQQFTDCAEILS